MRKGAVGIFVLIFFLGCSRPKTGTTPEETIGNLVHALNTQDSELFLANLDKTAGQRFQYGDVLRHTFDTVKGTTISYTMIKTDTDGNVANVSFWVSSQGKMVIQKMRVDGQLYKEDGAWKFGVVEAVNGKQRR